MIKPPQGTATARVLRDIGSVRQQLSREQPLAKSDAITDADELQRIGALPLLSLNPPPDPSQEGAALDAALAGGQPELPPISQAPDPSATLGGQDLIDTLLPKA